MCICLLSLSLAKFATVCKADTYTVQEVAILNTDVYHNMFDVLLQASLTVLTQAVAAEAAAVAVATT
jgi:hypothetical protein